MSGLSLRSGAQTGNLLWYDFKNKYHFGFTLGLSSTNFQTRMSENFLNIDTLQGISVKPYGGFYLGGIFDKHAGDFFNFRFVPTIHFAQRNIYYTFQNPRMNKDVSIESVYLEFPVLIKYKTQRHRNIRFYVTGGVKYVYDLASNKDAPRSLADPVVALEPHSFAYDIGAGLDIYFPFFKFSPELRLSNSFKSVLVKDGFVYTEAFDGIWSRIINFSLNFE